MNKGNVLKVVLVVPNLKWVLGDESTFWHFIPYNLCMLASMIRNFYDVRIVDAYAEEMTESQLADRIKEISPDVVGITVMMDQFADAGHRTAKVVKKVLPASRVVMGGVYPTISPSDVLEDKNIDYAVVGEGEYVFKGLLDFIAGNSKDLPAKGVYYKNGHELIETGRAEFITDLDSLPFPSYDLIDFKKYSNNYDRKSVGGPVNYPYARMFTSRGCPQKCSFCQVKHISGRKFRNRSAKNILKEIKWLHNEFGVQNLIFDDDNLFTKRKRAVELFSGMIEQGLTMPWASISTAVFYLDDKLLKLMKTSGCYFMNIAIESGSQRVLKEIVRKPVNYDYAKRMVALAKKEGIFVAANFIIGFPTETWNEIRETIQFSEELDADYIKIFHAIPLKHTKLWDLCVENNAFKKDFNIHDLRWSQGQIGSNEYTPNDLTILRAYEWDRVNFSSSEKRRKIADEMGVNEDELLKIRRQTILNAQKAIDN